MYTEFHYVFFYPKFSSLHIPIFCTQLVEIPFKSLFLFHNWVCFSISILSCWWLEIKATHDLSIRRICIKARRLVLWVSKKILSLKSSWRQQKLTPRWLKWHIVNPIIDGERPNPSAAKSVLKNALLYSTQLCMYVSKGARASCRWAR